MEDAPSRWPTRCLPLLVANESGWWIVNPVAFAATWTGEDQVGSLQIAHEDPSGRDGLADSVFGHGIITWHVPFLFSTDPGWNLLARGPATQRRTVSVHSRV